MINFKKKSMIQLKVINNYKNYFNGTLSPLHLLHLLNHIYGTKTHCYLEELRDSDYTFNTLH